MEHLFHLFGGGCGEHMLWPMLVASGSSALLWAKHKIRLRRLKNETIPLRNRNH